MSLQYNRLPYHSPLPSRQCLLCMPFTCTTRQCLTLSACLPVSLAFSLPFPRPNITGNSLHSMLLPFPNRYHHHVCPFLVLYSQKIESLAEELDITKQWCRLDAEERWKGNCSGVMFTHREKKAGRNNQTIHYMGKYNCAKCLTRSHRKNMTLTHPRSKVLHFRRKPN